MHKENKTNLAVAGVGAAVTGIGSLVGGLTGAGIIGFGLAHIVLGSLATLHPKK